MIVVSLAKAAVFTWCPCHTAPDILHGSFTSTHSPAVETIGTILDHFNTVSFVFTP